MSGVSTGTVDRILHNRGKVSEEAQKKVEKVLKEIDYHPNLIARSLALKKNYHFITLTPSFAKGEYWDKLCEGIDKAEQELFSYNVEVERMCFNQYDKSSFDELIPRIEKADCQGVVIATQFHDSVVKLASRLDQLQIPYILIDAFIENTNCVAYYGIIRVGSVIFRIHCRPFAIRTNQPDRKYRNLPLYPQRRNAGNPGHETRGRLQDLSGRKEL